MDNPPPRRDDEEEIIDMEISCVECGQKLYLPLAQARQVQASINTGGSALLICVCGAGTLLFRQTKTHD